MPATIESSFVLLDRASGPIKRIRRELVGMERDARNAGTAMDNIAGPKAARDLEALARETRGVDGAIKDLRRDLGVAGKTLSVYEGRVSGARRETDRMRASTDRLVKSMRTLGTIDARPHVEVDGLARARADLAAFRRELNAMNRLDVGPGPGFGGRGGFGSRAGVGLSGGSGGASAYASASVFGGGAARALGLAAVAALPAVQSLGGATTALGASLAGAGLGAGAGALAGGGALAAGVGALAAVAAPVKKNLEAATKAQQQYTTAVQDFGRKSKQAIRAKRDLDRVMAGAAPGTAGFLTQRSGFGRDWNRASRGAQTDLLGLGTGAMRRVRQRALPGLGADAGLVASAARTQGLALTDTLTGPASLGIINLLSKSFAGNLDEAGHTVENIALTLGRLAVDAQPFFSEGMGWAEATTRGWRESSKDIGHVRHEMAGYVDDLRAWGHLTESAFELVRDIAAPGRRPGTSMVGDLTEQLDHWDDWAQRNPVRIERFFDDSVKSTEDLAGALGEVAKDLHEVADVLTPVLSRFAALAQIGGGLGLLAPTAIRVGLGRLAGGGGAGGAGAAASRAAGGAAGSELVAGAGAGYLAARGAGALSWNRAVATPEVFAARYGSVPGARYGMPASSLGARSSALSRLRGPAASAGRFVAPIVAIQAALGAAQDPGGAGLLGRWRDITSSMSLGLVPSQGKLNDRSNRQNLGALQGYVDGLPDNENTYGGARRQIASLRGLRGRVQAGGGSADVRNTVTRAIDAEIEARKELLPSLRAERDARSRDRGASQGQSVATAFRSDLRHLGPDKAFGQLRSSLLGAGGVADRNFPGGRQLAQSGLEAARAAAQGNPALQKEYDKLAKGVSDRFADMGHNVVLANGHILSATQKDWPRIRDALAKPAEQARQRVSDAFSAIQLQAIGALTDMGYSPSQARSLVRGAAGNGTASISHAVSNAKATKAYNTSAASPAAQAFGPSPGNPAKIGDGVGSDRPTLANTTGGAGLMGANPNLGVYAALGAKYGDHVTSGARPGSKTLSGNVSFHDSGHAIDMAGGDLRGLARDLYTNHGSGLEELISPFPEYNLKNGKPFKYPSAIEAQHSGSNAHVHVADVDPGGAGGLSASLSLDTTGPGLMTVALKGTKSGIGGVAGALADAASGAYAAGLTQKLNGSLGGGGGGAALGGDLPSMIAAAGLPAIFNAIVGAESGGNPRAHNASGADGLTQLLGHQDLVERAALMLGRPADVYDPLVNLAAAKLLYDQNGLAPWTASRPVWGKAMGDGTGIARPRFTGSSIPAGRLPSVRRKGHNAGPLVAPGAVVIHAHGANAEEIATMVGAHLNAFADLVMDEIQLGHEETEATA
ncbi:hypothetical protein DSM104299_04250 [Baekduia alba]|uniref:hypothetical protein n=1 Tax=Baekduia alba TaxID=2997333 RepID=UPI0023425E20|nr:hypothetical protein [Baekduia alba]WCB95502.1 hypothetical protein DSM104299_04250 [Baekduia alba]